MFVSVAFVPGGIGVAVHLYAAALPVVVGDGAAAAGAAADAGHQAAAAAGLGVADCWPEAAWMAAQNQEWELIGHIESVLFHLDGLISNTLKTQNILLLSHVKGIKFDAQDF